jgi:hypothetical protein
MQSNLRHFRFMKQSTLHQFKILNKSVGCTTLAHQSRMMRLTLFSIILRTHPLRSDNQMKLNDNKSIIKFLDHFIERKRDIDEIKCNSSDIYKKTLYSIIIDALSKSAFPGVDHNKERFVKTISQFGEWDEGKRISLPFLNRELVDINDESFYKIKRYIEDELNKWPTHSPALIKLDRDSELKSILSLLPNSETQKDVQRKVQKFKHHHLLWEYRNCLIHEFRQPGYGHEQDGDDFPFYQGVYPSNEIRLCYPTEFFAKLIETIIYNLKGYFISQKINPYNSFEYGAFWTKNIKKART